MYDYLANKDDDYYYVQHKTWCHIDVGYNNYTHTLFNARIYGVMTDLEFSNFDIHLLQNKIIYFLICIIMCSTVLISLKPCV